MINEVQIFDAIKDQIEIDGVFLVSLTVAPGNRISVYIDSFEGVSIDYCIQISRLIEQTLNRDVEDFELEVSSPGVGQPLKVLQQYQKIVGKKIEVITKEGLKIKGQLAEVDQEMFLMKEEKMVKPEGKKRKELQIFEHRYKFEEVKSVKEIIEF